MDANKVASQYRVRTTAHELPARFITAYILAIIGALALAASPFVPWVSLGMLTATGVQKTGNYALLLSLFAVFAGLMPIISLIRKKSTADVVILIFGLLALALTILFWKLLSDDMANRAPRSELLGSPQIGAGLYLAAAGSFFVVVGSLLTAQVRRPRKDISNADE